MRSFEVVIFCAYSVFVFSSKVYRHSFVNNVTLGKLCLFLKEVMTHLIRIKTEHTDHLNCLL